jgi:hypothetical protein
MFCDAQAKPFSHAIDARIVHLLSSNAKRKPMQTHQTEAKTRKSHAQAKRKRK